MCGLGGWFSPAETRADGDAVLAAMRAALAHRGPDGDGSVTLRHAGLVHTRLAIIDLDSGQQPMCSADGRYSIVFNGEIYNYRALRRAPELHGTRFRTESDTEVIVELVARAGIDALARLRGMYALAIWDREQRRGWLARDRYGIKPLFWTLGADGALSFASEAKALLAAGVRARLDPGALHLVMNFRYLPGDGSLFQGVRQLAPGTVLSWSLPGRHRVHTLPWPAREDRAPDLLGALGDSVRAHLTADVEVATYLSGGIDSAAITALARDASTTPIRTFTADVGDDPHEARNAARTAELLGVANLCQRDDPAAASLAGAVWHVELPKVNAVQIGMVARHAARHVKVVLSGLGGDELFLGYRLHRMLRGARQAALLPALLRRVAAAPALAIVRAGAVPFSEPQRALTALTALGDWPRVYALLRNVWDGELPRAHIYGPRMLDAPLPAALDTLRTLWPDERDPLRAGAEYEWRHKMVNDLLWQEDRMSMAHALEVRVPFVDTVFAGQVQRLDAAALMPGGELKGLLKQVVRPLLPAEVLARPKSGFQVEAGRFVSESLARWVALLLSPQRIEQHGLFNVDFVRRTLAAPRTRAWRWHWFMLYLMLGAQLWLELFENGRSVAELDAEAGVQVPR